ncbi:Uncharacterised protein [uncultured Clostridium sp.]|nr:Uncharacterised protein [uncultured Clostridium sp.]
MNKYQVLISNIHFLYTVKTSVHVKSTLSNGNIGVQGVQTR